MNELKEDNVALDGMARYMLFFFNKKKPDRQQIVMEWIRYTSLDPEADEERRFFLPFIVDTDDDDDDDDDDVIVGIIDAERSVRIQELSEYKVCKCAIATILDFRRTQWKTCLEGVKGNYIPVHGNKGKLNHKTKTFNLLVKDDLLIFFENMQQLAAPTSTRVVREETGSGLRDGEEKVVELPSLFSKRGMYQRFCSECGWRIETSVRGKIKAFPVDGSNQKPICTWSKFMKVWDDEYPNLRLAKPREDICSECHAYHNRFKYLTNRTNNNSSSETNEDDYYCYTISSNINSNEEKKVEEKDDGEINNLSSALSNLKLEENEEIAERSATLEAASVHVKRATIQRNLANNFISQAIEGKTKPHHQRSYTFIGDSLQNISLPHYGFSQPGDTYYYSPLNVNVFGLVDCSEPGGTLSAHVYDEGVGKKGGNNVASLIMKELGEKGLLNHDKPGFQLTIIMDNCSGQNKNNFVLRLAVFLVDAGYFRKVNFVFYVVGHTKNACDRWFSILKRQYRRSNVFTFKQLLKVLNTNEKITVKEVRSEHFKEYGKFLQRFYKKFESGTIKPNHVFSVDDSLEPGTIAVKVDDEGNVTKQKLVKKGMGLDANNWKQHLRAAHSNLIPIPECGIPDIKKVELYTKYRPLVPEEFRDTICPFPGDDILQKIKKERNDRVREKKLIKQEKQEKIDSKTTRKETINKDSTSESKKAKVCGEAMMI